jgi:hypothetical protein
VNHSGVKLAYVYILKDVEGRILYIGQARDPLRRYRAHRYRTWGGGIASIELLPCDSLTAAIVLEAELIKRHLPPHNIDGNPQRTRAGFGERTAAVIQVLAQRGPSTLKEIEAALGEQQIETGTGFVFSTLRNMVRRGDAVVAGVQTGRPGSHPTARMYALAEARSEAS